MRWILINTIICISVVILQCNQSSLNKFQEVNDSFENKELDIRDFQERTYIYDGDFIQNNFKLDTVLARLISKHSGEVGNKTDSLIYVPRNIADKKHVTKILLWKSNRGRWRTEVISTEHEPSDIDMLLQKLTDKLQNFQTKEIDYIFLPVRYYDIEQLEVLQ